MVPAAQRNQIIIIKPSLPGFTYWFNVMNRQLFRHILRWLLSAAYLAAVTISLSDPYALLFPPVSFSERINLFILFRYPASASFDSLRFLAAYVFAIMNRPTVLT